MNAKWVKEAKRRSERKLPFAYHILHWQLRDALRASLTVRCRWQPIESSRDGDLIPCSVCGSKLALFESWGCAAKALHNGLLKDIDWWVCPAGHRRAWGDGAWSERRSAGGCSSSHGHLCLKKKKKKKRANNCVFPLWLNINTEDVRISLPRVSRKPVTLLYN